MGGGLREGSGKGEVTAEAVAGGGGEGREVHSDGVCGGKVERGNGRGRRRS